MDTELTPVTGEQKDTLVTKAENTPDFRAYHDYFIDQLDYNISDTHVTEQQDDYGDTAYIVSFVLDDEQPDTNVEINILLENDTVIDSSASIDHYDTGELTTVEYFSYEDGQIQEPLS